MTTRNPLQERGREAAKPPLCIYCTQVPSEDGVLVPGSRASLCNGSANLFGLMFSDAVDIQFTALANNVTVLTSHDPTMVTAPFASRNGEVIGNCCTASSLIYVMNPETRQCYGNWRKGEEEKGTSLLAWFCPIPVLLSWKAAHSLKILQLPFCKNRALHECIKLHSCWNLTKTMCQAALLFLCQET